MAYVRDQSTLYARMFAPLDNIPEDPATGSAAAALSAYLAQQAGHDLELNIHQGVEMGRPSLIRSSVSVKDGQPVATSISGEAVKVMEGSLTI